MLQAFRVDFLTRRFRTSTWKHYTFDVVFVLVYILRTFRQLLSVQNADLADFKNKKNQIYTVNRISEQNTHLVVRHETYGSRWF